MGYLDYITIAIFTIGIIITGLMFSKSGKSMKSFFAAGGDVPWGMAGLSLFMGFFSAGTFVVWGSIAYSSGWVAVTIQWMMCIAGLLVGLFIAGRWQKTNALTAAEYISNKLGIKTQKRYTILFLLVSLFTTGSFLYPVGKIIEISTGLSLSASILLIGCVSILYVAVGGLKAVVVTDVLQFIILFAAIIIVLPLSFGKVGGIQGFLDAVPKDFFHFTNSEYSWGFMIAFAIYNAVFIGGNWAFVQRYTSVKNEKSARKVGFLFSALYTISPVLWMLPPMVYRALNPTLTGLGDEGAYLMMCKEVLPSGLLGLMLGGMVFATASSLNATLNISSAVFTNDIFKKLFVSVRETTMMKVARISTIGFGLLAIVVALLIPLMGGVVNVVISVAALTGVPLYLPILWTLFSKRQTGKTVFAITLISLAVNAFFKFFAPGLIGVTLSRANEMILGVGFPVICLVLYEIYSRLKFKAVPVQTEPAIDEKEAEPEEKAESSDKQDNHYSMNVLSVGITISGLMILILGFIASSGKGVVCVTGGTVLLLGLWLNIINRKK